MSMSHDYPLPVGHAAVSPAVPLDQADEDRGFISQSFREMTISL